MFPQILRGGKYCCSFGGMHGERRAFQQPADTSCGFVGFEQAEHTSGACTEHVQRRRVGWRAVGDAVEKSGFGSMVGA